MKDFITHLIGAVLFSIFIATAMGGLMSAGFELFTPHDAERVTFAIICGLVALSTATVFLVLNKKYKYVC